jgi:hypothetical protein
MRAFLSAVFLFLVLTVHAAAARQEIVLYRIGDGGQEAWTLLGPSLEAKGYAIDIVQGETDIDKHVEKVSKINRGSGKAFIAVEIVPAEKSRVMVAEATERKGEGRFLSITEVSSRFSEESDRLAACMAEPFGVKVTHLPLFPLLGVSMPAVAIKLELKPDDAAEAVSRLKEGIEKYLSERTGR